MSSTSSLAKQHLLTVSEVRISGNFIPGCIVNGRGRVGSDDAGGSVVNEQENGTNDPVQPQKSFLRRYRAVIIVVIAFAVVVFLVLRHHRHQQELAAMEGDGPGGRGRGSAAAMAGGGRRGAGGGGPNGAVAVTVATAAPGENEGRIPALGASTPRAPGPGRPPGRGRPSKGGCQRRRLRKK